MSHSRVAALLLGCVLAYSARAGVVLNEILYHAPDQLDELQFIELHNTDNQSVDLSGWKLTRAVRYTFPARTSIPAGGFLLVCKNQKVFQKHYGLEALGTFEGSLGHSKGRIDLLDAAGKRVDSVSYRSRPPWPVGADGCSSTLERICPAVPQTGPENWAPSPPTLSGEKAGGTPGARNSCLAAAIPPVIQDVRFTPEHPGPGEAIRVEARVPSPVTLARVELRFRVASSGQETEEQVLLMTRQPDGRYTARLPGQKSGQIVRFRVRAVAGSGVLRHYPHENDLRPALSVYVQEKLAPETVPHGYLVHVDAGQFRAAQRGGGRGFGMPPGPTPPARGNAAFVFVDGQTRQSRLFDFICVTPRNGGRKIRLHKDRPLNGMTTINLIFEYLDRFAVAEHLAYEVYRQAGNAAPLTDFVRTWVDGRPLGYQLLVEQPNKAFLRRHHLRTDGHLYKCQWFGQGLIGQHEKKTRKHEGHRDLIELDSQLRKTSGDEQWTVIKNSFDVEQVVNYFAVNMVLSHWDGYFNNYFTYHDVHGSGKWTMYPWDQDKTWGHHDHIRGQEVFVDMPLTFGMAGDRPPGWSRFLPAPLGFGFGPAWWRPGGAFSRPLLANSRFRKLFLARTRELVEKVYTEEIFFPLIKKLGARLGPEMKYRAELYRADPRQAEAHLQRTLDSLREHLVKRRRFLLSQDELKKAGPFNRADLK